MQGQAEGVLAPMCYQGGLPFTPLRLIGLCFTAWLEHLTQMAAPLAAALGQQRQWRTPAALPANVFAFRCHAGRSVRPARSVSACRHDGPTCGDSRAGALARLKSALPGTASPAVELTDWEAYKSKICLLQQALA